MTYRVVSNFFDCLGRIDLDGDEERTNASAEKYDTFAEATERAELLGQRFPNALVDIMEDV